MDKATTQSNRLDVRCYIAEAIGSGILVLIGPGAAMVAASTHAFGHEGVALAFGLVITLLIAALGTISGAHLNPAVTLAFWSVDRFPKRHVLPYIIAQCIGAIGASFILSWLLGPVGNFGATLPTLDVGRSFAVEAAYSGILAIVILAVATDDRVPSAVAPFVVGTTVFAGALVTGPLTGGSFNPARSLGPAVAGNLWEAHWVYWAAPIIGMLAAARLYEFLRGTEPPSPSSRGVATGVEVPI
ncbi:MAG: MIP/aquaporin family protein [Gemmatimonas sp.]